MLLAEVALVVGLVLFAAGVWRRGARWGWATALLGVLVVAATLVLSAGMRSEVRRGFRRGGGGVDGGRPIALTTSDLAHLRWIEGTWRGTGAGQAPFYERYRFVDDSTLLVESFADSTLGTVSAATRFELRRGRLTSVPGPTPAGTTPAARWVATHFAADTDVAFAPLAHARNGFTWRRQSSDAWTAILAWPATATGPEREKRYEMERWR